jgi:hypothetical protein
VAQSVRAIDWTSGDSGFDSQPGQRFFSLPPCPDWRSSPIGTRDAFLGLNQPGREADHLVPSSAKDKNPWSITSIPPYPFMGRCLITGITVPLRGTKQAGIVLTLQTLIREVLCSNLCRNSDYSMLRCYAKSPVKQTPKYHVMYD